MRFKLATLNGAVLLSGALAALFALDQGGRSDAAPGVAPERAAAGRASDLELAKAASPYDYERDVQPLLETYCYDCHGDGASKGDFVLDEWEDEEIMMQDRRTWKEVMRHVGSKVMPPAKRKDQPSEEERRLITTWIEKEVFFVDCSNPDPGRVTIRRLNRQEYNNTIRDLVGVNFEPAADFPPDDTGYGFDNIGDVLSISPLLLEKYVAAAEKVMDQAIRTSKPAPLTLRIRAPELAGGGDTGSHRVLATEGRVSGRFKVRSDGEYTLRVRAGAHQAGNEPAKMRLLSGSTQLGTVSVSNTPDAPEEFEQPLRLEKGEVVLAAEFINDFYDPGAKDPTRRDRNLLIEWIELAGA